MEFPGFIRSPRLRHTYARDKSPYAVEPRAIFFPKDERDVWMVIRHAAREGITITPRAAGTNVCGSAIGKGVILVLAGWDRILEKNGNRARVQPGVVYQDLNNAWKGHWLPYQPSSGNTCTVGGNVATHASGLHGVKYGSVDKYVKSLRFVSPRFGIIDTKKKLPPELEKEIRQLQRKLKSDSRARKLIENKMHLKVSTGYNLRALLEYTRPQDIVTHLLVGSVGTLGVITELEMIGAAKPKTSVTAIALFHEAEDACKAAAHIVATHPSACEVMDADFLKWAGNKSEKSCLLIQWEGHPPAHVERLLTRTAHHWKLEYDPKKQKEWWAARSHMLQKLEEEHPQAKAWVEDVAVPLKHLPTFTKQVREILKKRRIPAVMYGHAGEGNLHIRPFFTRQTPQEMQALANDIFGLVFRYGGTIGAEHGTGRNKAPYLRKEWGDAVYPYFTRVKKIFDPDGILNPDVMFSSGPITKNLAH